MLTKTNIECDDQKFEMLYLAPVAVAEKFRKQKIGSKLIRTALNKAKTMGFKAVFLAGNPAYYNRFGFIPTSRYGIKCNLEIPEDLCENIMLCELLPQALKGISGIVEF